MCKTILTNLRPGMQRALIMCVSAVCLGWTPAASIVAAAVPPVQISQVPMTVAVPAHPQIMLAVANSQSMDGSLSGAIMTGSGFLGAATAALQASSSPVNFTYTVGAGFTPANPGTVVCTPPPGCAAVTAATPAGTLAQAPYTVLNALGQQVDNSPSRLNVAKAGIIQILNTYMSSADFGLMDYNTSNQNPYTTWVYQMSPVGGFVFSSTPGPGRYVANPCFGVSIAPATTTVQQDCAALNTRYASQSILTKPYMLVSSSSDDPAINDVLYSGGSVDPVCVVYGTVSPSSPFTGFSLAQYESNNVRETYPSATQGCGNARQTGPTNAGFVPFSTEVMYEERGFGFYASSETFTANHTAPWSDVSTALVGMQSAGPTPTAISVSNAVALFAPFLAPETSNNGTTEMKATALQSPAAALIAAAQQYFQTANPPSTNGCIAQRYIVLLTDGLPTMDRNGHAWPPLGSTSASPTPNGWSVSAVFNPADGSLTSTNDQALSDVITQLGLAYNGGTGNSIKTFIIGLGAGVDPTVNPTAAATLRAMAVAGGTGNASPVGYFAATSPTDVTNDLNIIITQILAATQSTASAAVNSTGLNTTSVVYQSQFDTSDTFQDWTGNLFAYPVLASGAVSTVPNWSLQTQLDGQNAASRIIATWDRNTNTGTPFEWNSGTPASGIATSTLLGTQLMTFTPDPSGQDVLTYLRGDSSKEVRNGGKFRNRSHKLGDIVDSSPLYIGAPSSPNQTPSYVAFAQAHATRPPMVYVGANDGMLHAVDAVSGSEKFAYIPRGGYSNLVKLASPFYNAQHVFFLNGSPQASDVQFSDNTWHTLLVSTERQGGKSIFAIDVTDPASINNEAALAADVLWDVTDVDMGLGFSTPALGKTAAGWMVFVGNGYNSPQQKPFLYALDPQHGTTLAKIDLCAQVAASICNLSAANGLSTVIAVNSSGQALGFANLLYAGDLQGNLWRIDTSNSSPSNWTVSVLFHATDPVTSLPQPITTQPVASLNPQYPQTLGTMVFIVTGQFLGQPDLATTQIQSVYGVFDPPTPSGTPLVRGTPPVSPAFVTSTGFVTQTLSIPASNAAVVVDTSHKLNIPTNPGWIADLTLTTGERGVTDPRLESGGALVFTTYSPQFNAVSCKESGTSQLYVLNYATGGSFMSPQFDITGDGAITTADMVNMGGGVMSAPVGMSLGNVFAAAPTIRTANFLTASAVKLITLSDGTIKTVIEKGSSKSRTAWWEIRQ
jgi:type IV pilus assembly protein PilY1